MKKFRIIIFIFIVLLYSRSSFAAELGIIRMSLVEGDVQIYAQDTREWVPASINMPLIEGDRIWVPERARAEIHIKGGTYLRLDANSSLSIIHVEEDSAQFYITRGYLYVNDRRGGLNHIQIDTPFSSVSIYDDAVIMVDVSEKGHTNVSVLKSYAYVESRSGKTRVPAGKTLRVGDDLYADLSPIGSPDEWEKWNRQRDNRFIAYGESSRYLPDELLEYSYDFDHNGRWVYARPYGYVWTPSIRITAGWSPYRIGKWTWYSGNYVWISYEPWGWVPYHYGRWAFITGIGWGWVPPSFGFVYWAPGYVAWVYTPSYVAWVPLAPGEIYYGRGYYGPHSVNIININIEKTVIKHEYKNIRVKNSVTVVDRDAFTSGKKKDVRLRENPFLKERVSVGPPEIKPSRETYAPVYRNIPASKRPPEKVRQLDIEEIKDERKRSREVDSSVFRPETSTERMPVKEEVEPKKRTYSILPEKRPEIRKEKRTDIPAAPPQGQPAREPQPSLKKEDSGKVFQERGKEAPLIKGPEKQDLKTSPQRPSMERPVPQQLAPQQPSDAVIEYEKGRPGNGKDKGRGWEAPPFR